MTFKAQCLLFGSLFSFLMFLDCMVSCEFNEVNVTILPMRNNSRSFFCFPVLGDNSVHASKKLKQNKKRFCGQMFLKLYIIKIISKSNVFDLCNEFD